MDSPPLVNSDSISLAVLAGGEGSRMGRPKAELLMNGRPILDFLLDRIRWPGPTVLVTAPGRQRPPGADRFDREAVDPVAGLGPLCGLLTGLQAATTELVVFTTVDMPGVGRGQLDLLIAAISSPETLGVMYKRPGAGRAGIEPFPSAFRTSAAHSITDRLATSRRSVVGLAEVDRVQVIEAPAEWPAKVWANLNTPADLARFVV